MDVPTTRPHADRTAGGHRNHHGAVRASTAGRSGGAGDRPTDARPAFMGPRSWGANAIFCDGHVAFLKDSVATNVIQSLATRAGGGVMSDDAY